MNLQVFVISVQSNALKIFFEPGVVAQARNWSTQEAGGLL